MRPYRLTFSTHAIMRMFERGIQAEDVEHVLETGELLEEYLDEEGCVRRLILGWQGTRPLHVVTAEDPGAGDLVVVTVYEPFLDRWEPGFRRRRT